jgi:parallel beta-helix repeat protein
MKNRNGFLKAGIIVGIVAIVSTTGMLALFQVNDYMKETWFGEKGFNTIVSALDIPYSPTFFEARTQNSSWIRLNWTKGAFAVDTTVILAKVDTYPVLGVDAELYNGSGSFFNHTGLTENTRWFYRCYSFNSTGYYSNTSLYSHDTTMGVSLADVNVYGGSYTKEKVNYSTGNINYYETLNQLPANCTDHNWSSSVNLTLSGYNIQYLKSDVHVSDNWMVRDGDGYRNFTINQSFFDVNQSSKYLTFLVQRNILDNNIEYYLLSGINDSSTVIFLGGSPVGSGLLFYEQGIVSVREGWVVNFTATILPIYVDDDFTSSTLGWGVDHFDTIQKGVDNASDNATVYVWDGTYLENVVINNAVSLIGNGSLTTTINGSLDASGIIIFASYTVVSGFTIESCILSDLYIINSNYCTISENRFLNTQWGVLISTAQYNTVYNNIFDDCIWNMEESMGASDNYYNISMTPGTNIIGGSYLGGNYYWDNVGNDIGNGFTIPYDIMHYAGGGLYDYLPLSYNLSVPFVVNQVLKNCTGNYTQYTGVTIVNVTTETRPVYTELPVNSTDTNWSTYNTVYVDFFGNYYIKYRVPASFFGGYWEVKDSSGTYFFNVSNEIIALSSTPGYITFYISVGMISNIDYYALPDIGDWSSFILLGSSPPCDKFYEEGVFWNATINMSNGMMVNFTAESQLNISTNLINATETHNSVWNTPFWDILFNATGNNTGGSTNSTNLTLFENIVNASGSHQSLYNPITGWSVWANYTGNTTAIHTSDTMKNVTGSLSTNLNMSGYLVTSAHESKVNLTQNVIDTSGSLQKSWTGSLWKIWANYTGAGVILVDTHPSTKLKIFNNTKNVTGKSEMKYNLDTGWEVWENYSGKETSSSVISSTIISETGPLYLLFAVMLMFLFFFVVYSAIKSYERKRRVVINHIVPKEIEEFRKKLDDGREIVFRR